LNEWLSAKIPFHEKPPIKSGGFFFLDTPLNIFFRTFIVTFSIKETSMKRPILSAILIFIASAAMCQKLSFVEQLGVGYSTGTNANSFSPKGNGGGFAFGTTGDFLLHNLVGLGLGFDINVIRQNNRNESVSPVFADFKLISKGQFRPYIVIDPGYCFYYNSTPDGAVQKGSFSLGSGAGLWFPSKRSLHLFLQGKYNYTSTTVKGIPGSSSGSLRTVNFLLGYKF
jgi:hypothetical protein